jgi:hypothetical protein
VVSSLAARWLLAAAYAAAGAGFSAAGWAGSDRIPGAVRALMTRVGE